MIGLAYFVRYDLRFTITIGEEKHSELKINCDTPKKYKVNHAVTNFVIVTEFTQFHKLTSEFD